MFSANNQISGRQLNRLIVIDFLGIMGLLMPQIALYFSLQDGLIAIFYAIIMTLFYTFLILKIKQKIKENIIDYIQKKAGRFCAIIVGFVFVIKYFAFAVAALCILGNIVNQVLLPEVNPVIVIAAMIIICSYSVMKGIESRGRMAEILYYVVLIPIIIILLFSFKQVDKFNLTPFFVHSQGNILKTALIIFLLFAPSELLLFGDNHFVNDRKTRKSIYYGILTVGVINLLIFAVNVGIFGVNGMLKEEWPTLTLMQVVEISGLFFERQDGIMSIFYIVSLFSIISSLIYYIVTIIKRMFKVESNRRYGWITVLMLFIVVSIFMNGNYVWNVKSEKTSSVEIEDRQYIMAIGIDVLNGELSVTYAFADTASQTGQEVSEENNTIFNCSVDNIYEAENIYSRQAEKKLDYSHIKAIVLGVQLLENKEYLDQVASYFKNESEFARSINLCGSIDTANNIISLDKDISGSIGVYLQKMFTNNVTGCTSTVADLIANQADEDMISTIPILNVQQNYPNFIESVIMKGLNVVKYCNLEDTTYYGFMNGEGDGSILDFSSYGGQYGTYQVKNSDVNTRVKILAGRTVYLTLNLTGTLESRDITIKNPNKDEINGLIEDIVSEKISVLREEYNVDYMQTHKLLGIYDRDLWVKYLDDNEKLFENLYIEVKSDFTIK